MNRRAAGWVAAASILVAEPCTNAWAQDLSSAENEQQIWFVPRLVSALNLDVSLARAFPMGGGRSRYPSTALGLALGWQKYFDGHGHTILRLYALYDFAGGAFPSLEGRAHRVGGGVAFTIRGITTDWVFGTLSLYADGSGVFLDPPDVPILGVSTDPESGFQVGIGLESTFGTMIVVDPYLFAETGASLQLSYLNLPSADAWEVCARWLFRFDWAIPRVAE